VHRERKLSALRRSLGEDGHVRGDEVIFFCKNPSGCDGQHHKPKLQANIESDVFHCWVCGWGGRDLRKLLALGGKTHADYIDYVAERDVKPADQAKEKQYDKVRLPSEFRPLCVPHSSPYYRQAMAYLAARGITSDDILTYKLGYCEAGRYAERIIVPSFDEYGELNFFVGRALWERVGAPYLSGKFDKDIVFNDLLVDWSQAITLVEGPFDAIKAGTNAIPLQGKLLGRQLRDKILARHVSVVIALDSDAINDAVAIAESLTKYGVDVSIASWPREFKDPGEMERAQVAAAIEQARPVSNLLDLVRFKMQHPESA
jgi:DNA primase